MKRGEVYLIKMPEHDIKHHHCERGIRPCVIVSSNKGCKTSEVIMVCPITSKCKKLSCNVTTSWSLTGNLSQVLCNQIITVPREILINYKGYLPVLDMRDVDIAIQKSLGLFEEVKDD